MPESELRDWLVLVAELVKALSWPLTVLIAVVLLRKPLGRLIPLLRKARYAGVELEFGEKLAAAEAKADSADLPKGGAGPAVEPEEPADSDVIDLADRLAPISPRAAVIESWTRIEAKLRKMHGPTSPGALSIGAVVRNLRRRGMLTDQTVSLFEDLRALRNRAAHSEEPSVTLEQALEYARLANRLLNYLDRLRSL